MLDLQDNDAVVDRLIRRLSDIAAALHETNELTTARSAWQAAEEIVTRQRAQRKDLELADSTLETKIKQAEQRLYSGLVKNPKELLDLQNDIASLKRQKDVLDDQLFNAMVALEESEATLTACAGVYARIEPDWRASQSGLIREHAEGEAELARHQLAQAELRAGLSAADLALYDQLRRRKGGLAVVELLLSTKRDSRLVHHTVRQRSH